MPYIFTLYGKKFVVNHKTGPSPDKPHASDEALCDDGQPENAPHPTDYMPVTPATLLTGKNNAHQDMPDNC